MSEPRESAYQTDPVDPAAKSQPAEGGVDEAETSIDGEAGPVDQEPLDHDAEQGTP